MSVPLDLVHSFQSEAILDDQRTLQLGLATTPGDVRAVQRLRYQVFVQEMGAQIPCAEPGLERDHFDGFCQYLIVRDLASHAIVGCYRLLDEDGAKAAGGFYSSAEFDLSCLLQQPGKFLELGRTCVHPDYRTGATIALLWQGLARYMTLHQVDYLMGCASIPLAGGTHGAHAIYQRLAGKYLAPEAMRVYPWSVLPKLGIAGAESAAAQVPPLLKGYLRAGALICGEPAWDPEFNVADLFVLLARDRMTGRYARHFVDRK